MAEVKEVTVPDIGDFDDVPVIEVLVSAGDTVAEEDPLVTLESDKATMDVPVAVRRRGAGPQGVGRRQGRQGHAAALRRGGGGVRQRRRAPARDRLQRGARPRPARSTPRPRPRRSPRPSPAPEPSEEPSGDGVRAALREPRGAPAGAREGHRPLDGGGHRPQGPHHQGGPRSAQGGPVGRAGAGPGGRRRGRARAAVAHQEDLRPAPAAELADDPARHPARRGGHHRPGGVPQGDQRLPEGRQGHDGRAAREGGRHLAEGVPRGQLVARRRGADPQAPLQHRLRRRHAARPARPGDQERRPQGHPGDRRRADAALRRRPRGQAQAATT